MKYQVTFYLFIRKCGSFAKMPQKYLLKLVFKHNRMDRFHHEMTSQEKVLLLLFRNLSHFVYVLVRLSCSPNIPGLFSLI